MSEPSGWTGGAYSFRFYADMDEDVASAVAHGLTPVRLLTNEGQVAIMAGDGDDIKRVALVDCQTRYKRGEGYRTICAERDATARLFSAAPDLFEALSRIRELAKPGQTLGVSQAIDILCDIYNATEKPLAKATGGAS